MKQAVRKNAQLHRYMEIERLDRSLADLDAACSSIDLPRVAANQSPANVDDSVAANVALAVFAVLVVIFAGPTIWHQFRNVLVAFGVMS